MIRKKTIGVLDCDGYIKILHHRSSMSGTRLLGGGVAEIRKGARIF